MRIDDDGVAHFDDGGDVSAWFEQDLWGHYMDSLLGGTPGGPSTPGGPLPVWIGGGDHTLPGDSGVGTGTEWTPQDYLQWYNTLPPGVRDNVTVSDTGALMLGGGGLPPISATPENLFSSDFSLAPTTTPPATPTAPSLDDQIIEYVNRPGVTVEDVVREMNANNISVEYLANVLGLPLDDVQSQYDAVMSAAEPTPALPAPPAPTEPAPTVPTPEEAAGISTGPIGYVKDALGGLFDWFKKTPGAIVLNPTTGTVTGTWGTGGTAPYVPVGGTIPGTVTQPGVMTGNAVLDKILQVLKGGAQSKDLPGIIEVIISEELGVPRDVAKVILDGAGDIQEVIRESTGSGAGDSDDEEGTTVIVDPTGGGGGGTGTVAGPVPGEETPVPTDVVGAGPVPGEETQTPIEVPGSGGGGAGAPGEGVGADTPSEVPGGSPVDPDGGEPVETPTEVPGSTGGGGGGGGALQNFQQTAMRMINVENPELADIDYIYDFASIFANPEQARKFVTPAGVSRTDDYEVLAQLIGDEGTLDAFLKEMKRRV